jgi:hypothetical protein
MQISDPIRLRYDERPLRGFLIHLGVYVLVVLGLIAFNLVNNPTKLWSLWVLAGWGIGIAAHGGVIWMKAHPGQHHWFAEKRTRGFAVHAFVYVAVILLLFVVDLVASPSTWWIYWVVLGWGAGTCLAGVWPRPVLGLPWQYSASRHRCRADALPVPVIATVQKG